MYTGELYPHEPSSGAFMLPLPRPACKRVAASSAAAASARRHCPACRHAACSSCCSFCHREIQVAQRHAHGVVYAPTANDARRRAFSRVVVQCRSRGAPARCAVRCERRPTAPPRASQFSRRLPTAAAGYKWRCQRRALCPSNRPFMSHHARLRWSDQRSCGAAVYRWRQRRQQTLRGELHAMASATQLKHTSPRRWRRE